jgi:hypothetical protein
VLAGVTAARHGIALATVAPDTPVRLTAGG